MYSSFGLAKKYLRYYLTACNGKGHGMHSPFVFDFILHVLNNESGHVPPNEIEEVRKQFFSDNRMLQIEELGAGSRSGTSKQRTVREIAESALKSKKYAQLLFRMVKRYKPQTILELGTSLGITTAYLASANPAATIVTIEGSEAVAAIAKETFATLGLQNTRLLQGAFDDLLAPVLRSLSSVDLAYVDGNHRYGPTTAYFHQLLPATHNDAVLVFDDIHWSAEMERAWDEIKSHPAVRCTVDVFFLGFVFFRNEFKTPQHFTIRF